MKCFRAVEGVGLDSKEGTGSYTIDCRPHHDVADECPAFPAFIMSYSEVALQEYGAIVLGFLRSIGPSDRIRDQLSERSRVQLHRVRFGKTEDLDIVPGPSGDWTRKHYPKPDCFAHEREWRLVVYVPTPLRFLNDTLKETIKFRGGSRLSGLVSDLFRSRLKCQIRPGPWSAHAI